MAMENRYGMPSQSQDERCGKCQSHVWCGSGDQGAGYYCLNLDSEAYLDITEFDDRCVEFEPRAERRF